jgi:vacuolar protein-sorting-associated protein 4
MAFDELEKRAVQHANEAILLERKGDRYNAITKYERAIEILNRLCHLYPKSNHAKIYSEYISQYKERIGFLKGGEPSSSIVSGGTSKDFLKITKSNSPNVTWNDIADLEMARKAIHESIIYPYRRPDLFPLGWPRGILLFGPPGCGKTLLAAAVATEIDAAFYTIDAAQIMSKWLGESEKNVANLFNSARADFESGRPAIIFIDEIDSLVGIRQDEVGAEVRTRNQFMNEMDSIIDKNKNLQVYLIGATNKPWALDEPFIRRFQKRILVPIPDINARKQLFKIYTKGITVDESVYEDDLAKRTHGYSGSDIRDICQAAHIKVVSELFETGKGFDRTVMPRQITSDDFNEILRIRKPSVNRESLKYYDLWFEKFRAS